MKTSKQSILRLFQYRDFLIRLKNINTVNVFSDNLAKDIGTTSIQVRKDFSLFRLSGNKKAGYKVSNLLKQLDELLGKNKKQKVVIVGAGNIGKALMQYDGFYKEGLEIAALFDYDRRKYNHKNNPPVLPIEDLFKFVSSNNVKIGIIAVPCKAAQQVLDLMISAGIKGAMNFAPIPLKSPKNFYINNINLRVELESVVYYTQM